MLKDAVKINLLSEKELEDTIMEVINDVKKNNVELIKLTYNKIKWSNI
ncbi:hypothetical protein [Candidatus Nanopusillus massiliensis]|nr:hypothetical protein [Candidatus Nanopusillus massiliensis]